MRPLLQVRDLLDNVNPTVYLALHLRCWVTQDTLDGAELGDPSEAWLSDGVTGGLPLSPDHPALSRVPPSLFTYHEKAVTLLVEAWKQNQTLRVPAKQDRARVCIRVWPAQALGSLKHHVPLRHRVCLLQYGLFVNISIRAPKPLS